MATLEQQYPVLADWIKQARAAGYTDDDLTPYLAKGVDAALRQHYIQKGFTPQQASLRAEWDKTGKKPEGVLEPVQDPALAKPGIMLQLGSALDQAGAGASSQLQDTLQKGPGELGAQVAGVTRAAKYPVQHVMAHAMEGDPLMMDMGQDPSAEKLGSAGAWLDGLLPFGRVTTPDQAAATPDLVRKVNTFAGGVASAPLLTPALEPIESALAPAAGLAEAPAATKVAAQALSVGGLNAGQTAAEGGSPDDIAKAFGSGALFPPAAAVGGAALAKLLEGMTEVAGGVKEAIQTAKDAPKTKPPAMPGDHVPGIGDVAVLPSPDASSWKVVYRGADGNIYQTEHSRYSDAMDYAHKVEDSTAKVVQRQFGPSDMTPGPSLPAARQNMQLRDLVTKGEVHWPQSEVAVKLYDKNVADARGNVRPGKVAVVMDGGQVLTETSNLDDAIKMADRRALENVHLDTIFGDIGKAPEAPASPQADTAAPVPAAAAADGGVPEPMSEPAPGAVRGNGGAGTPPTPPPPSGPSPAVPDAGRRGFVKMLARGLLTKFSYGDGATSPTLKAFSDYIGEETSIHNFVKKQGKLNADIPAAERIKLKAFAEDPKATPNSVANVSPEVATRMNLYKAAIQQQSQKLVELGMLDKETADKLDGAYVHRAVLDTAVTGKALAQRMADARQAFMEHGLDPDEASKAVDEFMTGRFSPPLKRGVVDTGALRERMLGDPRLRALRGEVQDGVAGMIGTIAKQRHLIARGELMQGLATDIDSGVYGPVDPATWKTLPKSPKEFGALAGKSVPDPVARLIQLHVTTQGMAQSLTRRLVGWGTFWHTAGALRYPFTQFVENVTQSALSGNFIMNPANLPHYIEAFKQMLHGGAHLDAATAGGGMENQMFHEIRGHLQALEGDALASLNAKDPMSAMQKIIQVSRRGGDKARAVGSFSDAWFKLAHYIKATGGVDGTGPGIREGDINLFKNNKSVLVDNPDRFNQLAKLWHSQNDIDRMDTARQMADLSSRATQSIDKNFINFAKVSPVESDIREHPEIKLVVTPTEVSKLRATAIWVNAIKERPILALSLIGGIYGMKHYSHKLYGTLEGDDVASLVPFAPNGDNTQALDDKLNGPTGVPSYVADRENFVLPLPDDNGNPEMVFFDRYAPLQEIANYLHTKDLEDFALRLQGEHFRGVAMNMLTNLLQMQDKPEMSGSEVVSQVLDPLRPELWRNIQDYETAAKMKEPFRYRTPSQVVTNALTQLGPLTVDTTMALRKKAELESRVRTIDPRKAAVLKEFATGRIDAVKLNEYLNRLDGKELSAVNEFLKGD